MTINNPGDRSVIPINSSGAGKAEKAVAGAAPVKPSQPSSADRIAMNPTTLSVDSVLTDLASARAHRVSQLAEAYDSGRYAVDSAKVAQSLIGSAFL